MKNKLRDFKETTSILVQKSQDLGLRGVLKALWKDLFSDRTIPQWLYLILLSSVPIILEITSGNSETDWMGMFGSLTGILCVILVAEGRLSNYLFGTINAIIYLSMSLDSSFYGEVITTLYFFIMQPVGLYLWLKNGLNSENKENKVKDIEVQSLDFMGWIKHIGLTAAIWLVMGFAYQSISSARPFRDSVTDGTSYVGQLLMNKVYKEQWIFWIATNLFSIYLWWGSNIHIQAMYWVFTLNSIVGWYNWAKQAKKGVLTNG